MRATLRYERISVRLDGTFSAEPLADEAAALMLPAGTLVLVIARKRTRERAHVARVTTDAGTGVLRPVDAWTYRWPEDRAGVVKSIDAWRRGEPRPPRGMRKKSAPAGPVVSRVTPMLVREPSAVAPEAMTSPEAVARACADLVDRDREVFRVLHLDQRNTIISFEDVSVGIANASLVHPREVFRGAILAGAVGLILVHNHPSGDPAPSQEDKDVTRRLVEVGRTVGIPVLDHVIVGTRGRHVALASSGVSMP